MVRASVPLLLLLAGATPPVPPQHYTAPARAVDHVREAVRGEGLWPSEQGQSRFMRHANWLREDRVAQEGASIVHSNFATGTSFTYARDAEGRYRAVWITRVASTDRYGRYARIRTGRRERALGETCEVWNARRVGAAEGEGPEALSCDTADGITLWTRTGSAGTVFSNSRTLSFARRPVAADEAAPPRDMLRLEFWLSQPFGPAAETDYRVELAARERGGWRTGRRTLQRHGEWHSTSRRDDDGRSWLSMNTRAAGFMFEQEPNGRPVMLQAYLAPPGQPWVDDGPWLPMTERPDETLLGETCRWMRPPTIMYDAGYLECRTADGVPLMIDEVSRGHSSVFAATSVSRRRLSRADFAPPEDAVSWTAWGVAGRR